MTFDKESNYSFWGVGSGKLKTKGLRSRMKRQKKERGFSLFTQYSPLISSWHKFLPDIGHHLFAKGLSNFWDINEYIVLNMGLLIPLYYRQQKMRGGKLWGVLFRTYCRINQLIHNYRILTCGKDMVRRERVYKMAPALKKLVYNQESFNPVEG